VLQEKEYQPLGSDTVLKSDARVIAATNKDLEQLVQREEFRSDLYYRLNVVSLLLPPLRERPEDIPLLCEHFISRFQRQRGKDISAISPDVMAAFMTYRWPGNVRELENAIEYAFILCPGGVIQAEHLPEYLHAHGTVGASAETRGSTLADIERRVILQTLQRNDGRRAATARELGISKATLWRKLKKYSIEAPEPGVSK
jgi:transcriptional regulator with PAS, ATPase and Fis domain